MATGFMRFPAFVRPPDCKWAAAVWLAAQFGLAGTALAADISVIGIFQGRGAVLVIDNGALQNVKIGQKVSGITLISVDKTGAVIEDGGRRRTIGIGQHVTSAQFTAGARAPQVTLAANNRGQFITQSTVNGASMQFLVDTGANVVAIPGGEARRLGIDFTKGQKSMAQTANGAAAVYRIKLDSVKVGAIELLNVDAIVMDGGGLALPLLGMSFLDRVEMRREGDRMTLIRRY